MSDDYIDRLASLLPDKVLDRYIDLVDALGAHQSKTRDLEAELTAMARRYGVPDIDDPASPTNAAIQESLGARRLEINALWISTPPDWICPCCQRIKPDCARLGTKDQMLGKLVAHHDHIEQLIDVILTELSATNTTAAESSAVARRFLQRGTALFSRFDRIVICEDCNNAEGKAKTMVAAPKHFTFTPSEIGAVICPAANAPHQIDEAALAQVYADAAPLFEVRRASLKKLAERALGGTAWYEPVDFDHRDDTVDRNAQRALSRFGLTHVGYWTVRDIFLEKAKIDPKHAPAWRTQAHPIPRIPTASEIEFVIRGHAKYQALPEDWTCPGCSRPKKQLVRWSQNSRQFTFATHTRNIPDLAARYGTRKIELCDACNQTFQHCHKELRAVLGDQAMPDTPVTLDEIQTIIKPRPHALHEIDARAAEMLVRQKLDDLQFE